MATVSTTTVGPAAARGSEISRLGGVGALKLRAGPARRSLFGPVDHGQLRRDFERMLLVGVQAASKRWNFDFQNEMPGSGGGGVEWEALSCRDVPAFYRGCAARPTALPLGKRRTSSSSSSSSSSSPSSGERSPGCSSSPGTGDEYPDVTGRGYYRFRREGKRRQAAITEFFKVKKRKRLHYKGSSRQ